MLESKQHSTQQLASISDLINLNSKKKIIHIIDIIVSAINVFLSYMNMNKIFVLSADRYTYFIYYHITILIYRVYL